MSTTVNDITAVILAGGQGRRMGGQDKGLIEFNGKPLVEILIAELERQSLGIVINANRNLDRYRDYGFPVINDQLQDYQGPLAGFASAMDSVDTDFILTLPCDGPQLAADYAARFIASQQQSGASICVAFDGERLQPVHALIKVDLRASLGQFLDSGDRKIDRWYALHDYVQTDFSDRGEMFRNINTPSDQQTLQAGH
jgi:molybdenum cofactor guanylyltransferase